MSTSLFLVIVILATLFAYCTTFLTFIKNFFPLLKLNVVIVSAVLFAVVAITVFFKPSILLILTPVLTPLSNTSDLIYSIDSYETRLNAFMSYIDNIDYPYSTEFSFAFTTKLAACLSFLILIRGGVPRYRYDILTKLGWVKFLGFVLAVFIFTLVTFFLY